MLYTSVYICIHCSRVSVPSCTEPPRMSRSSRRSPLSIGFHSAAKSGAATSILFCACPLGPRVHGGR